MQESHRQVGNSQTLCAELADLEFEVLERSEGKATVIRFRLENDMVKMGDVLLILESGEIRFHGLIAAIDDKGWATASDRRGSTIPCLGS
jgi:hypothetical protein